MHGSHLLARGWWRADQALFVSGGLQAATYAEFRGYFAGHTPRNKFQEAQWQGRFRP